MNSHSASQQYTPQAMSHSLFVVDLTANQRVQLTLGSMIILLGFLTMCYPVADKLWFSSTMSILLAVTGISLNAAMMLSSGSFSKLMYAVGLKRYTLFILNVLIASLTLPLFPSVTLGYLAGAVLLYFLADEVLAIINAVTYKQLATLSIRGVDLMVTLASIAMLVVGFELRGELVVSLPLGIKLVLFGAETMLTMKR